MTRRDQIICWKDYEEDWLRLLLVQFLFWSPYAAPEPHPRPGLCSPQHRARALHVGLQLHVQEVSVTSEFVSNILLAYFNSGLVPSVRPTWEHWRRSWVWTVAWWRSPSSSTATRPAVRRLTLVTDTGEPTIPGMQIWGSKSVITLRVVALKSVHHYLVSSTFILLDCWESSKPGIQRMCSTIVTVSGPRSRIAVHIEHWGRDM